MTTHAHEKPFDPACLHCLLDFTIESWAKKHGTRIDPRRIRLDASVAISKLARATAELVYHAEDEATRHEFERFAHAELERAFHAESVSDLIVVAFDRSAA